MGRDQIAIRGLITDTWEPVRVALAWLITAGDPEFVEWVRTYRGYDAFSSDALDAPLVLAGRLVDAMEKAGCIQTSLSERIGPRLAILAKNHRGRFQQMIADFETGCLKQLPELSASDCPQDWLSLHNTRREELFTVAALRSYLVSCITAAGAHFLKCIKNEDLRAHGVLARDETGRVVERPADNIPATAITPKMELDDRGFFRQSKNDGAPYWKDVTLLWADVVKCSRPQSQRLAGASSPAPCTTKQASGGAKEERARLALESLYPKGIPAPFKLGNPYLCRAVGDFFKKQNPPLENVSDDAILRAAGRRRRK
jgi:hypothetical protein